MSVLLGAAPKFERKNKIPGMISFSQDAITVITLVPCARK